MATVELDPASGRYRIRFRYGGRPYKRTLKTADKREAHRICCCVEETLSLIHRGSITVPDDAEPGAFILSDGKRMKKVAAPAVRNTGDLFEAYKNSVPEGAKEANTLEGERRHMRHLGRHIKLSSIAQSITAADLQRYILLRSHDFWHGTSIRPDTIRKELTTFRLIWNWAVHHGHLKGKAPLQGLKYPLRPERPPFMMLAEIRRRIARGGLNKLQIAELWECLFLSTHEVQSLIDFVAQQELPSVVYPMLLLVAHLGEEVSCCARKSTTSISMRSFENS